MFLQLAIEYSYHTVVLIYDASFVTNPGISQAAETTTGATNPNTTASTYAVGNCGWNPTRTASPYLENALVNLRIIIVAATRWVR